ncbi:MAG: LacI family transcriptional regulator [Limnochordia bacterium]|nr:LacI family transcriptional regulator [Limnochordia bacterium]
MNVTIKDVAVCAGVSPSTVSRVIADHPRISPDTKEKVRAIMSELGYYPNAIARSLVNQTSNSIGVIRARLTEESFANPFFPAVIQGISSVAHKHRLSLVLSTSNTFQQEDGECLELLRQRRVDGVILLASHRNDQLIPRLAADGFPFVLIGRHEGAEDVSWVNNDNVEDAKTAVRYLLSQGHRRIACLDGDPRYVVSVDRLQGYKQACLEQGLPAPLDLVEHSEFSVEGGYQATLRLLERKASFSALFAVDDLVAIGAIRALQERNIKVGSDVSVVGFNDTILGACVQPALTSVHVPIYELGQIAVQMLVAQLYGSGLSPHHQMLPASLVIRDSA